MSRDDGDRVLRLRKVCFAGILLALISIYFLPLAVLYLFQRQLIFFPETETVGLPGEYGLSGVQVVGVETEDGLALRDWFIPPKTQHGRVIVVFHGAYINIAMAASVVKYFPAGHYGVFLCEYRGFGGSPGTPTEEGVYKDARAGLKWLKDNGYGIGRLIFYGASLGTGIAVQMAVEQQPPLLILHSPFSSISDVAKARFPFYPVDLLLKDRFDNASKIGQVKSNILILHGDRDDIVPIKFARTLFNDAQGKKDFMTVRGAAHIDLLFQYPEVFKIINDWIDKQIEGDKRK
jgi:uncharacterized protein